MHQEKEKLNEEMRIILARQPGPEAVAELEESQAQLRERTKQLKAVSAELGMMNAEVTGLYLGTCLRTSECSSAKL